MPIKNEALDLGCGGVGGKKLALRVLAFQKQEKGAVKREFRCGLGPVLPMAPQHLWSRPAHTALCLEHRQSHPLPSPRCANHSPEFCAAKGTPGSPPASLPPLMGNWFCHLERGSEPFWCSPLYSSSSMSLRVWRRGDCATAGGKPPASEDPGTLHSVESWDSELR